MLVYCDLHIHSCLSPCADDDMTPWNLVGMAKVKGLDVIALTDHNSARNTPEAIRAGKEYGVGVIPALEVNTREEVHMLTYFPNVETALAFGEIIYESLPELSNRVALFGNQILVGQDDNPVGQLDKLLLNATRFSVDEVAAMAEERGGVCIPAHINRSANGILGSLGMMPPMPAFPVVEVYRRVPCPPEATQGRMIIHSSDAHELGSISERDFAMEAEAPTAEAVFQKLRQLTGHR